LRFDAPVRALVENHHAHDRNSAPLSDNAVRRLARRLQPGTIDELACVMLADSRGRPPLESPETIARIAALTAHAQRLQLAQLAPQPLMLGRHLMALGRKPGPEFKRALDAAFEAQLDGAFADEASGVIWLRNFLG
jgi:tRNA nucleotidyltransferase (CCA-adding enzyme)